MATLNQASKLEDKVAIVTGSTRGIGRAIAKSLAESGARVVISSRSEESVASTVAEFKADGLSAWGKACDVREYGQVSDLMAFAARQAGGIDIIINNAGIGAFEHVAEMTPEVWDKVVGTNLNGVFYASHAAIPHLRARGGGTIINISSLAGKNAFRGGAAYNASKFGLEGLSEAMMLDLRHENIKVAYVMPGSVATEFGGRAAGDGEDWRLRSEDVAEMVTDILAQEHRALASRIELRPFQPPQKQ